MATKKERRTAETKIRKMKKGKRIAIISAIGVAVFGFLVFFFVSIFNMVYPPVGGTDGALAKKEKLEVVLYYSDKNELFLVPEKRFVIKEKNAEAQAKRLVKALIDGSKSGHINTIPGVAKWADASTPNTKGLAVKEFTFGVDKKYPMQAGDTSFSKAENCKIENDRASSTVYYVESSTAIPVTPGGLPNKGIAPKETHPDWLNPQPEPPLPR